MTVRNRVCCWDAVVLENLPSIAREIVAELPARAVVAVEGPMGVGKTTVIRAICVVLGVVDEVLSPTYGLANEYETANGEKVNHLDLYRLKDEKEAEELNLARYFEDEALSLVEWAGRAAGLLPLNTWLLEISQSSSGDSGVRKIDLCTFEPHGNKPKSD